MTRPDVPPHNVSGHQGLVSQVDLVVLVNPLVGRGCQRTQTCIVVGQDSFVLQLILGVTELKIKSRRVKSVIRSLIRGLVAEDLFSFLAFKSFHAHLHRGHK